MRPRREGMHDPTNGAARKEAETARPDGALQPVADEGGRHSFQSLVLDAQSVARAFDPTAQALLEAAQAGAATAGTGFADMAPRGARRPLAILLLLGKALA